MVEEDVLADARRTRLCIEFQLLRRIEQSAQIKIVDARTNRRARHYQTEMISSAIRHHIEVFEHFRQRVFIARINLFGAHAPAAQLVGKSLRLR